MKVFKNRIAARLPLAALVLIATLMSGCARKGAEEIKIGAVLPLTGDGAKYGEAAQRGIELAVEEINSAGGINGKKVAVVYEDSQGDPRQGVSAVQRLINIEKVPAVIGGLFSSVTLAVAPIMNQSATVLLSPTSSAPKITTAGDYIFRNVASDIFEGSIMGKYAAETLGLDKAAVLYINNEYGVGIRGVFKETFTSMGGTVLIEESFEQGASDFRAQLTKVKDVMPNTIYIVGYKELGQLLKQARELAISSNFLSTVMFEDPEIIEIAGGAAEGVIYSARDYDPSNTDELTISFLENFKNRYDEVPDIFAALSYDAMRILNLAIERGGAEPKGIKEALYSIQGFPGVAGLTSFDENGDVVQSAIIKVVRDGRFVNYEGGL